jgi:hypothetical protein
MDQYVKIFKNKFLNGLLKEAALKEQQAALKEQDAKLTF